LVEKNKPFLHGYVTVRKFGGYALPVPVQNKLLRAYCNENYFKYALPLCEIYLENNYMNFFATLKNIPKKSHIGMASIFMFPEGKEKFSYALSLIKKKELQFHFIFEDKVVRYYEIEDFYLSSFLKFYV
tara:strand:+ start:196 stop:582 length:387 start_codon:yes stop_codon:yes gene_type:complete